MTMKSTLIVPITLLATLAASVLVHDRLRTKPSFEDAAPTRTGSIATAHPVAPALVSPAPVSAALVQTLDVEPNRGLKVTADHVARTAFQISGPVLS